MQGEKPHIEDPGEGRIVYANKGPVELISSALGVEPNLVFSLMYMEVTHGWYERVITETPAKFVMKNLTILPMNVNRIWATRLNIPEEVLKDPAINIQIGRASCRERV